MRHNENKKNDLMKERYITEQNFKNSAIEGMGEGNQEEDGVRLDLLFQVQVYGSNVTLSSEILK